MNRNSKHNDSQEQQLDRLIDAVVAGHDTPTDGELAVLSDITVKLREFRDIVWPEPDFPQILAGRLQTELAQSAASSTERGSRPILPEATPTQRRRRTKEQTPDWHELMPPERKHGWARSIAGLVAGSAALGVLALILAFAFGNLGSDGDGNQAAVPPAEIADAVIAFARDTGQFKPDVLAVDASGEHEANITQNDAYDSSPAWAPDGNHLAITSDRDGSRAIYTMNADGSGIRRISDDDAAMTLLPAWASDGTMISYTQMSSTEGSAPSDIIVKSTDGETVWTLSETLAAQPEMGSDHISGVSSVWSPIAPLLLIGAETTDHNVLFIANVITSQIERYDMGPGETSWPIWSPDGQQFAIADGQRVLVGAPGGVAMNPLADLSSTGITTIDGIAWSPDGSQIAVAGATGEGAQLAVVDVASGTSQTINHADGQIVWPQWAPQGHRIGYLHVGVDTVEIVAISPDGSQADVLANDVWAGDGSVPFDWRPNTTPFEQVVQPTPSPSTDGTPAAPTETVPGGLTPTPPATEAQITVVPYELTCDSSAAINGSGFPANTTVEIRVYGDTVQTVETAPDGTFSFENLLPVTELIPDCGSISGEITVEAFINDHVVTSTPVTLTTSGESTSEPATETASLVLQPAVGTCETTVTATGTNFVPGTIINFLSFAARSDNGLRLSARPTVADDGTFTATIPMNEVAGRCNPEQMPPGGIVYNITAHEGVELGTKPTGSFDGPFAMASVIFTTNSNAQTPEDLHPEMIAWATEKVRIFLDEPDATFDATVTGEGVERIVNLQRNPNSDSYDAFTLDPQLDVITYASIQSNTSESAPADAISEDEALALATSYGERYVRGFSELTQRESSTVAYRFPSGEEDQVLQVTWQLKANDQVWLPTGLGISIDLETGRIISWQYSFVPYRGPLEPQVSENDARTVIEQMIADQENLSGATIRSLELTAWSTLGTAGNDDPSTLTLAWFARLDGVEPMSGAPNVIVIDALTGEEMPSATM